MEKLKDFGGAISRYLLDRESLSERGELYQMYESTNHPDLPSAEDRARMALRVRRRILAEVSRDRAARRMPYLKPMSVAASLLLVAGLAYWMLFPPDRLARTAELAEVAPGGGHTVVLLPSGETVDVGDIQLEGTVSVGGTVIGKSGSGEIRHADAENDAGALYTLLTPRAATAEIVLADGTKVMLNAESKLRYPAAFGPGDRIVALEGEAYFQVARTSEKSRFIVRTEGQEIQVLGTKFNVQAEDGNVRTTLAEGSVRVLAGTESRTEMLLASGRQALWENGNLTMRTVDLESALGWTKGVFYFDGTNTAEVLRQMERWYGIDISYRGNKTTAQYRGKIARNLSLDKLVGLLSYADFKVEPRIDLQNRINLIIK